jgi:D-aminoacyl-tRNA deacylase
MRAVIQRVTYAKVEVEGTVRGEIGPGLLVLLGVSRTDTAEKADFLAGKVVHLRIFNDDAGKMNRSLLDTGGAMLAVSQFTLYGDCRKGRRPSFVGAAAPEIAETLYKAFLHGLRALGVPVAAGRFGAVTHVELVNDGPVTLIIDAA